MDKTALATAKTAFEAVMASPSPAALWQLQKALLQVGDEPSVRARAVARAFHGCLRGLESKTASRGASRWGAALGTAAVASVSAREMADEQDTALHNLLQSLTPALLEIGASLKTAQAWEVEAGLIYDDLAWFLYDELWDISVAVRPDLSAAERGGQIDLLLDPLLDTSISDGDRAALVINIFRAVLAACMEAVLAGRATSDPAAGG